MRIFYFVTERYPVWRFDLVELFGHELPKKGIEVAWSMRRNDAGLCAIKEQNGQRVYLPASFGRGSPINRIGNRLLEVVCEIYIFAMLLFSPRFDVIQVRDSRYTAGFWAWLAARITGAKYVHWVSFPFPENDAEKSLRTTGLKRFLLAGRAQVTSWWLYRFLLQRCDHVFVQSEEMRSAIASQGIPYSKMTPVPMGIPQRLFDDVSPQAQKPECGHIIYVGTLAASRRLDVVIDAFASVFRQEPSARLLIVGEGDVPEERRILERRVQELGLSQAVSFTGFVQVETVWKLIGEAAIALSPFYPDRVLKVSSPTKLIEYMALGKPVICNDQPEQSAIIAESHAGLCVPWASTSFADAMIWMLRHPGQALEMGKRGPAWVAENRTYPIIAEGVRRKYSEIEGLPE